MPKVQRVRRKTHLPSARPVIRDSTPEPTPQGVETVTERESLQLQSAIQPTKKEKALERRASFLQKLSAGSAPTTLSKSHTRRMKRRTKEKLAGESMTDLSHALASLEADCASSENPKSDETKRPLQGVGRFGPGSSRSLSKSQRKRMLDVERFRHPLILQNPDFAANPFHTIQIHAKNTLVKQFA